MIYPENAEVTRTYEAGEDLSAASGLFVKPGSTPLTVLKSTVAGAMTLGVITEGGASGKGVAVCEKGYLYVKAEAAAYTIGQELTISANAKVTAAAVNNPTTDATGEYVCAIALEAVTVASGGSLYVRLLGPYKK